MQQHADVRTFLLSQGWRDDSANNIVVVGSGNNSACGNVHRGCRCATDNDGNANDDNTAANEDAIGDTDNILC
jgi:hypothetical protein